MIVELKPSGSIVLHSGDWIEQVSAEPAVAHGTAVAFDVDILLWITIELRYIYLII